LDNLDDLDDMEDLDDLDDMEGVNDTIHETGNRRIEGLNPDLQ
jgi:hypothetical protein